MELGCGSYEYLCVGFLGGLRCVSLVKGMVGLHFINSLFKQHLHLFWILISFDFFGLHGLTFMMTLVDLYVLGI